MLRGTLVSGPGGPGGGTQTDSLVWGGCIQYIGFTSSIISEAGEHGAGQSHQHRYWEKAW